MRRYCLAFIFLCSDFCFLIITFFLAMCLRNYLNHFGMNHFGEIEVKKFLLVFIVIILSLIYEKIYVSHYDFWQESFKVIKALSLSFLLISTLLLLNKINLEYSRSFILIYFIFLVFILPISKRIVKKVIFSFTFLKFKVLVLAKEDKEEELIKEIKTNWYLGFKNVSKKPNLVMIDSSSYSIKELNGLIEEYLHKNVKLYVIPFLKSINFANSNLQELSNIRTSLIEINNKLLIKRNIFIKFIKIGRASCRERVYAPV